MYVLAIFDGHRSYTNGDNNYSMDILEKAELTASIRHIARFLKLGIPICNSKITDTADRKKQQQEHRPLESIFANAKMLTRCLV